MIKLPKEVKKVIRTLEEAGYDSYAVGGCVRDSLIGLKPYDWDISTSAKLPKLKELFPKGEVISETYSVIRMNFLEDIYDEEGSLVDTEGVIVDVATFRKDGEYSDGRRPDSVQFVETIEEDLPRRDFTMNGVADNGGRLVDLYNGRVDISERLIRTIGEPEKRFQEDPVRMLRAIRFVAELGFDLAKDVYEGIVKNYTLLEKISIDRFRREFTDIMTGAYAGKGLRMLLDTGIFSLIIGDKGVKSLGRREKNDLLTLCDNIHKTKQVPERRLGLLYTVIGKKAALYSIKKFNFDKKTEEHLIDAVYDMPRVYFMPNKETLKKFIYERGWDRYHYLANLEKAQRIALEHDSRLKIEGKMYMVSEIEKNHEPIFQEDLAIDGNDLIEAEICSGEEVGKMLTMLVETVHGKPEYNKRSKLLALAKKYKRNKLAAYTRGVKWLR